MGSLARTRLAALQRVTDNAIAIYDLLDAARGAVKVADIEHRLGISARDYRRARQHLLSSDLGEEIYITHEGLMLTKYRPAPDQRFWHLAWCLGLIEVSGQQLVLDEDMLSTAPEALARMWNRGQLRSDRAHLERLQHAAHKRLGTLLKVAEMYRTMDRQLQLMLLPHIASRDWNDGLRQIRNRLASLS